MMRCNIGGKKQKFQQFTIVDTDGGEELVLCDIRSMIADKIIRQVDNV